VKTGGERSTGFGTKNNAQLYRKGGRGESSVGSKLQEGRFVGGKDTFIEQTTKKSS